MSQESRLGELLLWLCSIASPIGEEAAIATAIRQRLGRAPEASWGNSLTIPLFDARRPGRPHIALVGHTDTVRTENGPARIEGDRVFGAGASDMKSGLACMLFLAEELSQGTISHEALPDVSLTFYAREEGPYEENELGPLLERSPLLRSTDLAVFLEPSDNKLHLGCTGSLHATVTFRGRTAHSARPWQGDNAIYRALGFLARVSALEPEERVVEGLAYRNVTSVTRANDGGRGRNVIPDVFGLNVNHRCAPDVTLEEAKQRLVDLVQGEGEVVFTDESPPAHPARSHPLVSLLEKSGVRAVEPKQAWTDVGRFYSKGISAVNFGPGENAQAHQKNESTAIPLLAEGYAILLKWLFLTLGPKR